MEEFRKTYEAISDASGNVIMLADPLSGSVVASYHYDPYGNLLSATGPQVGLCPFRGKGLYTFGELPGLMFAGHRVTDGRIWLSRDPSGEGSDLNLYRLYGGDPINLSDPSGLSTAYERDPLADVPGYRSYSQVMIEARAEVAAKYGNLPDSAVVEHHSLWFDKTFGDAVAGTFEAKKQWYWDEHRVLVEVDAWYAKDYKQAHAPRNISADNRSEAEIRLSEFNAETVELAAQGKAPSSAATAVQIVDRHPGKGFVPLLVAVLDAAQTQAPDLAAAWAGLAGGTGLPKVQTELPPAGMVVRGQPTFMSVGPLEAAPQLGQPLADGRIGGLGPSAAFINDPVFSDNAVSRPSARYTHDQYVFEVLGRVNGTQRSVRTPWSDGAAGTPIYDGFDPQTQTYFEANTSDWNNLDWNTFNRKRTQISTDQRLLRDKTVPRVVWFGTQPLPSTGLGGVLAAELREAGIDYYVVNPK